MAPHRWRRPGRRIPTRSDDSCPTGRACESWARPASLVVEVIVVQRRAQIMSEDVLADLPSLVSARLLVEAEVDAAVDPGVVDVGGDLLPGGIVEDNARQLR